MIKLKKYWIYASRYQHIGGTDVAVIEERDSQQDIGEHPNRLEKFKPSTLNLIS